MSVDTSGVWQVASMPLFKEQMTYFLILDTGLRFPMACDETSCLQTTVQQSPGVLSSVWICWQIAAPAGRFQSALPGAQRSRAFRERPPYIAATSHGAKIAATKEYATYEKTHMISLTSLIRNRTKNGPRMVLSSKTEAARCLAKQCEFDNFTGFTSFQV